MHSLAEWGPSGNRAQAGPLSYVLIFAMILAGATVVLAGGGMALTDAQDRAEMERAEHTMTLFDSRAAMVALGESETQTVSFGQDSGIFETRSDTGYLAIKHADWNASEPPVELFNRSLGAVVYENGNRELAYQGGGVWRLGPEGKAQIISPPEFHYRGATLTLPVVRVDGSASASGSVTARISGTERAQKVYPNASATYPSPASNREYLNPIRNGSVAVYVKSAYYEGWATYFRQRTQGEVTVFHSNETTRVKLKSIGGAPGKFDMPLEGNSLEVSGFGEDHPLNEWEVTLTADGNFNNGHWSLYSSQGGDEFEMHIWTQGKCTGSPASYNDDIDFSIYYYNASTGVSHEWQNSTIDPYEDSGFSIDCSNQELTIDFMTVKTNLTYDDLDMTGTNNKWCYSDHIEDRDVPAEADVTEHPDVIGEKSTFNRGSGNATMEFLVNHYMERMGTNYDLTVKDGPGNSECLTSGSGSGSSRIDEDASFGTLLYDEAAGAQFITYLHVTDNQINVTTD